MLKIFKRTSTPEKPPLLKNGAIIHVTFALLQLTLDWVVLSQRQTVVTIWLQNVITQ